MATDPAVARAIAAGRAASKAPGKAAKVDNAAIKRAIAAASGQPTKPAPSLLKQWGGIVGAMPGGLVGMAGDVAVDTIAPARLMVDAFKGDIGEKGDYHKYMPFLTGMGRSFRDTGEHLAGTLNEVPGVRSIAPKVWDDFENYREVSDRGGTFGAVLNDVGNLTLLAGGVGAGISRAGTASAARAGVAGAIRGEGRIAQAARGAFSRAEGAEWAAERGVPRAPTRMLPDSAEMVARKAERGVIEVGSAGSGRRIVDEAAASNLRATADAAAARANRQVSLGGDFRRVANMGDRVAGGVALPWAYGAKYVGRGLRGADSALVGQSERYAGLHARAAEELPIVGSRALRRRGARNLLHNVGESPKIEAHGQNFSAGAAINKILGGDVELGIAADLIASQSARPAITILKSLPEGARLSAEQATNLVRQALDPDGRVGVTDRVVELVRDYELGRIDLDEPPTYGGTALARQDKAPRPDPLDPVIRGLIDEANAVAKDRLFAKPQREYLSAAGDSQLVRRGPHDYVPTPERVRYRQGNAGDVPNPVVIRQAQDAAATALKESQQGVDKLAGKVAKAESRLPISETTYAGRAGQQASQMATRAHHGAATIVAENRALAEAALGGKAAATLTDQQLATRLAGLVLHKGAAKLVIDRYTGQAKRAGNPALLQVMDELSERGLYRAEGARTMANPNRLMGKVEARAETMGRGQAAVAQADTLRGREAQAIARGIEVRAGQPPAPGYVRLFRGEGPDVGAEAGSMFSDRRQYAENFGANGRVVQVDVPRAIADAAAASARARGDVGYDLPYEWVDRSTPARPETPNRVPPDATAPLEQLISRTGRVENIAARARGQAGQALVRIGERAKRAAAKAAKAAGQLRIGDLVRHPGEIHLDPVKLRKIIRASRTEAVREARVAVTALETQMDQLVGEFLPFKIPDAGSMMLDEYRMLNDTLGPNFQIGGKRLFARESATRLDELNTGTAGGDVNYYQEFAELARAYADAKRATHLTQREGLPASMATDPTTAALLAGSIDDALAATDGAIRAAMEPLDEAAMRSPAAVEAAGMFADEARVGHAIYGDSWYEVAEGILDPEDMATIGILLGDDWRAVLEHKLGRTAPTLAEGPRPGVAYHVSARRNRASIEAEGLRTGDPIVAETRDKLWLFKDREAALRQQREGQFGGNEGNDLYEVDVPDSDLTADWHQGWGDAGNDAGKVTGKPIPANRVRRVLDETEQPIGKATLEAPPARMIDPDAVSYAARRRAEAENAEGLPATTADERILRSADNATGRAAAARGAEQVERQALPERLVEEGARQGRRQGAQVGRVDARAEGYGKGAAAAERETVRLAGKLQSEHGPAWEVRAQTMAEGLDATVDQAQRAGERMSELNVARARLAREMVSHRALEAENMLVAARTAASPEALPSAYAEASRTTGNLAKATQAWQEDIMARAEALGDDATPADLDGFGAELVMAGYINRAAQDMTGNFYNLTNIGGVDRPAYRKGGLPAMDIPSLGGGKVALDQGAPRSFKGSSERNKNRTEGLTDSTIRGQVLRLNAEATNRIQNKLVRVFADTYGTRAIDEGLELRGLELTQHMQARGLVGWDPSSPLEHLKADMATPESIFLPEDMFTEFVNANRKSTRAEMQLSKYYDRMFMGTLKTGWLALSPKWLVGNVFGNMLMGMAEVGVVPYSRALAQAIREVRSTGERTIPSATLKMGFTHSELGGLLADTADKPRGRLRTAGRQVVEKSYAANEFIDDVSRAAIYLAAEGAGATSKQAIDRALLAAGNFSKMSPFERTWLRRAWPFYPWYRHITKLTLSLPFNHPARVVWSLHLAEVFGDDEAQQDLPWFQRGSIPVGDGADGMQRFVNVRGYMPFQTPENLPLFGFKNAVRSMTPAVSMPLAIFMGVNAGQGFRPLTRSPGSYRTTGTGANTNTPIWNKPKQLLYYLAQTFPQGRAGIQLVGEPVARYDTGEPMLVDGRKPPSGRVSRLDEVGAFLGTPSRRDVNVKGINTRRDEKLRGNERARRRYAAQK